MNTQSSSVFRQVKLNEVVIEAQSGFACGERERDGVIQLRMNNVNTFGQLDWTSVLRVPADERTKEFYSLKPGDVLFNNTNSTELVGKSVVFNGYEEPVVFSNHFTRIRINGELIAPKYLALWLQSKWQEGLFAKICDRWIGQSAVHRNKLLELELPLPTLEKQEMIVTQATVQMEKIARMRAAAKQQSEAIRGITGALLREVFDSENAKQWERQKLKNVCTIHPGQHILESDYNRNRIGIAYLTGPADFGESYPMISKWTEKPKAWAIPGDVLVTVKGAGVGKVNLAPNEKVAIGRQLMAVRPNTEVIDQTFLYRAMSVHLAQLQTNAQGATVPGLDREEIESLEIVLPPITEQRSVANQLSEQIDTITQLRIQAKKQLDAINSLPYATLREVFSVFILST